MDNRTIAAISTPLGSGGIGIIRISGPNALPILRTVFAFRNKKANSTQLPEPSFSSHHVYHGYIHAIDRDEIIDEVLAFFMAGPNSYTREDVVEIQSHSGYVVLDRILSTILDAGAELAQPGEFTQKAFLNGRIDLTQAEAVIDLINAPCETAAKIAVNQATGGMKAKIEVILDWITELQGKCEALIEFEESDALALSKQLNEIGDDIHHRLLPQVTELIQKQKASAIFCEGVLLAIAGVPNVGKSSLLNQLVEKETAIVSEFPGTTRDVIREYLSINGIPVVLCDTAGLRDSQDPVECIGIDRAHDHIDRAQLILFVVEATRELDRFEDQILAGHAGKRTIVVINKNDIAAAEALKRLEPKMSGFTHLYVSAKTGSGIPELKQLIFDTLVSDPNFDRNPGVTPNLRQRKILENIQRIIASEKGTGDALPPPELMAEMLTHIRSEFEKIAGSRSQADLYDYIFKQFCIGK